MDVSLCLFMLSVCDLKGAKGYSPSYHTWCTSSSYPQGIKVFYVHMYAMDYNFRCQTTLFSLTFCQELLIVSVMGYILNIHMQM